MPEKHRSSESGESDHVILLRMLEDAKRLCLTGDALLVGQYHHLQGRIAALLEVTSPTTPPAEKLPS
jgi:hypothetical protein